MHERSLARAALISDEWRRSGQGRSKRFSCCPLPVRYTTRHAQREQPTHRWSHERVVVVFPILMQTQTNLRRRTCLRRRLDKAKLQCGNQWSALEVGRARPLAIPIQTKLAAASPNLGQFVSPGSKRAYVLAFRTMLTGGVSPMSRVRSVSAVTTPRTSVLRDDRCGMYASFYPVLVDFPHPHSFRPRQPFREISQ
jgi:hypothetical protein